MQAALAKEAANSRLLQLAGIDSIVRGMDWEHKRADAWSQEAHKAVWGGGEGPAADSEDDMRMLVGGDVNFGQPQPQAAAPQPAPAKTQTSTASKLGTAALVAATVVGGGLAGAALSSAIGGGDAVQFEDTNTQVDFGIGYPEGAKP